MKFELDTSTFFNGSGFAFLLYGGLKYMFVLVARCVVRMAAQLVVLQVVVKIIPLVHCLFLPVDVQHSKVASQLAN